MLHISWQLVSRGLCAGCDRCLFLQKNIAGVYHVGKKPLKSVVKVIRIAVPAKDAVYNYSIQTLNSTQLAKKELYREMAKVRGPEREAVDAANPVNPLLS